MLMDWVDLRGEIELERLRKSMATLDYPDTGEPSFPVWDIVQLLRPDNAVTDETKTRIATFIEEHGHQMAPEELWEASCPKGVEKWLVPFARRQLEANLNQSRKRASQFLTDLGIEHPEPVRIPDLRFRVRINGQPWPGELTDDAGRGPELKLRINYEKVGGKAFSPQVQEPDLLVCGADEFVTQRPISEIFVFSAPISTGSFGADPRQPWLVGNVRLPLDSGKTHQIDIRTVELSVRPKFSRRSAIAPEDNIYEAKIGRFRLFQERFIVKDGGPLALPRISPGDYTIQIRHPGALPSEEKRFTIDDNNCLIEPELMPASTLVVPLEWPELKSQDTLPYALHLRFIGSRDQLHDLLRSVIQVKRKDGTVVEGEERAPAAANGRFPDSVIFPYLPPGEYEVESPDRVIDPVENFPGCIIQRSSINVVIREDSPVFVVLSPLKVLYTRKD